MMASGQQAGSRDLAYNSLLGSRVTPGDDLARPEVAEPCRHPSIRLVCVWIWLAVLAVGCRGDRATPAAAKAPVRIVSLSCAATDILDALQQLDRVVAVEADCPVAGAVGKERIANDDHAGRTRPLNVEAVLRLRPDLVIAKDSLRGLLDDRRVPVLWLAQSHGLDAIPPLVRALAMATGVADQGDSLLSKMTAESARIAQQTAALPRVRVYYESTGLGRTVGKRSTVHAMIELAGGINIAGAVDQAGVVLTHEAILAADPEVILLSPFADPVAELVQRKGFDRLKAVRSGRIHRIPMERRQVLLSTPRCVEGCAEFFVPWIHPELAAQPKPR